MVYHDGHEYSDVESVFLNYDQEEVSLEPFIEGDNLYLPMVISDSSSYNTVICSKINKRKVIDILNWCLGEDWL